MRSIADKYSLVPGVGVVVFDPMTLAAAASTAATAAGGAISAGGTLAGGSYAKQAGQMQKQAADFQAQQLDENATQAIASGQRQALDTRLKTSLAMSRSRANAAGNGVNAGSGSAAENEGELAQRGEYQALTDMFNGESTATGLQNQAKGVRYTGVMDELEGNQKASAAKLAALGTLASTAGSMFKTYSSPKSP